MQQQRVLAEGQLMKRLDHPNITKFRDVVETVGHLHFILEYIDSGSLASLIQRYGSLSEKLCIVYIRQVLNGLCYLHEKGIVHRDISELFLPCVSCSKKKKKNHLLFKQSRTTCW
jgi:serine/threonine protein kinase